VSARERGRRLERLEGHLKPCPRCAVLDRLDPLVREHLLGMAGGEARELIAGMSPIERQQRLLHLQREIAAELAVLQRPPS
jgi:hypothetical protein